MLARRPHDRFAPLFPEWATLCQAVQALLFASALSGTTFFVSEVLVIMRAPRGHEESAVVRRAGLEVSRVRRGG